MKGSNYISYRFLAYYTASLNYYLVDDAVISYDSLGSFKTGPMMLAVL